MYRRYHPERFQLLHRFTSTIGSRCEPFQCELWGRSGDQPRAVSGGYGVYTYDWGNGNTDTTLVVSPFVRYLFSGNRY